MRQSRLRHVKPAGWRPAALAFAAPGFVAVTVVLRGFAGGLGFLVVSVLIHSPLFVDSPPPVRGIYTRI